MTETLHWYAETSGGVRQGDAPVHPGCGAVHLSAEDKETKDISKKN